MRVSNVILAVAASATVSAALEQGLNADAHPIQKRDVVQPAHKKMARSHRRHLRKRNGNCKSKPTTSDTWSSSNAAAAATTHSTPVVQENLATPAAASSNTWKQDTWANQNTWQASSTTWTPSPTTQAAATAAVATSASSAGSSNVQAFLNNLGITSFIGEQFGLGSWFYTNDGSGTNGHSWCQTPYQDSWTGFAIDVSTMLSNFGGDTTAAGKAYCGLEAKVTNPANGNTALIYLADGFDPAWVRTPSAMDLTRGAWQELYGSLTDDHNIVMQNLRWEFTGNRNPQYSWMAGRNW